ncbi:MAG: DUF1611 domain-containing protein [Pseudomonadota bacterium]
MRVELQPPFLLFLGDAKRLTDAKTAAGLVEWRREDCIGELRLTDDTTSVGLTELSVEEAVARGAKSLIIGVAPLGGRLPDAWVATLIEAARAGLHIINGLHDKLTDYDIIVSAAHQSSIDLIDLRTPPTRLTVGTGAPRRGKRILTVGTDCAVGKKYAALAMTKALQAHDVSANFCATGQTGIMISGRGVPLDCIPCDFISGAIETLSPNASSDTHWDVIEGQGSLYHPSYAGVSLGLIHGAQADGLILCSEVGRDRLDDLPDFPAPGLAECAALCLEHARLTNPDARLVGVCLNTSKLWIDESVKHCEHIANELGVPTLDPIRHSMAPMVESVLAP